MQSPPFTHDVARALTFSAVDKKKYAAIDSPNFAANVINTSALDSWRRHAEAGDTKVCVVGCTTLDVQSQYSDASICYRKRRVQPRRNTIRARCAQGVVRPSPPTLFSTAPPYHRCTNSSLPCNHTRMPTSQHHKHPPHPTLCNTTLSPSSTCGKVCNGGVPLLLHTPPST